jgi:two-component system, NarL family, sensor histidine kinase DesK
MKRVLKTLKTFGAYLARGAAWWEQHLITVETKDGADEAVASSGVSPGLWWLYVRGTGIVLVYPLAWLVVVHPALGRLLLAVAGVCLFVPCYLWLMGPHPVSGETRIQSPLRVWLLLAPLTALTLALGLAVGSPLLWLLVCVSAAAGLLLPLRQAFLAVTGLTFLTLGLSVGLGGGFAQTDWPQVILLTLLVRASGLDLIGLARFSAAIRDVHAARRELARLAVVEERLRVARDLHDLLGRNLSVMTLKSELAGHLIAQEPTRAAQEMREVERTARQTLREVREAVAGYRLPRLASELDGARQVLEAAGITCETEETAGGLPVATEALLAWVVREGVTNVIRHSRARRCTIRVTRQDGLVRAEVVNDGRTGHSQATAPTPRPGRVVPALQPATGNGLAGLAERAAAQGGHLEAGPLPPLPSLPTAGAPGFRLCVEVPVGGAGAGTTTPAPARVAAESEGAGAGEGGAGESEGAE